MSSLNLAALSGKTVLASTFAHGAYGPDTFKPPEGFVKLNVEIKNQQSPDFAAAAYVNPKTGELVVAYRGSDKVSEAAQAAYWAKTGTWNGQFTDAASFAKQAEAVAKTVVDDYAFENGITGAKVTTLYTGHSLGGLLAQVISKMFGHDAQVFDSLGGGRLVGTAEFARIAQENGQPAGGHDITGKVQNYATSIASDQGVQLGGTTNIPALEQLGGIGFLPVLVGALTGGWAWPSA